MAARRIEVIKNHLSPKLRPAVNYVSADPSSRPKVVLSQFQKDFYDRCGYLLVKGLISDDILEKCRVHFIDICNGVADKGMMTLMKEILKMDTATKGEFLYNKIQDILNDEVFSLYTEDPVLLDYAEAFVGPNIMGMHSMLINKPPGTSIHPPHQDLHYFPFRPVEKIVAAWTAMEPVFKDNGCLYIVPGSHKGVLHHHSYPDNTVNKAYHGIQNSDEIAPEEKRVYLPMDKGDTVFFHPLLVHGSGPNSTNNFRKAISCHYASSDCYYVETVGTSQENISKEIEQMAKKKFGIDTDIKTIWHLRGKLVRGERLQL